MKFCLVTSQTMPEYTPIFIKEAKRIFDEAIHVPLSDIQVRCANGTAKPYFGKIDLTTFDAVYCRFVGKATTFEDILLNILEHHKVYTPNSLEGYQISLHKYQSVQRVAHIGVPIPETALATSPRNALKLNTKIGFPAVLKLLQGNKGKGVMLVKSEEELKPILETIESFDELLFAQKYVESAGKDYRVVVVGDKTIGIRRDSQNEKEWRANVSLGGKADIIPVDPNMQEISLRISELLGLEICGVDFLGTGDEPLFIEVNFCPGLMAKQLGTKLAKYMIKHIYDRASEAGK